MWNLYEKRIDQYLQDKHFANSPCHHRQSPVRDRQNLVGIG